MSKPRIDWFAFQCQHPEDAFVYTTKFVPAAVPGALTAYDLPDLVACLATRRVHMVNVTAQNGHRAWPESLQKAFAVTRAAYATEEAEDHFTIRHWEVYESMEAAFSEWVE